MSGAVAEAVHLPAGGDPERQANWNSQPQGCASPSTLLQLGKKTALLAMPWTTAGDRPTAPRKGEPLQQPLTPFLPRVTDGCGKQNNKKTGPSE